MIRVFSREHREKISRAMTIHGLSHTRFYYIFRGVKARCNNKSNKDYPRYGGRGIRCEWSKFDEFKKDMFLSYRPDLTLERIDTNGDYCKENCRWASRKEQARNRTSNHNVEFCNEIKPLSEWAEVMNFRRYILENRLRRGWNITRALTEKVRSYGN